MNRAKTFSFRRKSPPTRVHGVFFVAFLAGLVAVAVSSWLMVVFFWWVQFPESPFGSFLFFLFPCFFGGLVSGAILQFDLSKRRLRVLYLAAASPAMPIWLVTVVLLLLKVDVGSGELAAVAALCADALAGSLLGYGIGSWIPRRGLPILLDLPLFRPNYTWWNEEPAPPGGEAGQETGDEPPCGD